MDYRKTLNIPKIDSFVKVKPAEVEFRIFSFWNDHKIYENRQKLNKSKNQFLLFDMPIPAYGHVSIQNAMNMVLKDIVIKYKLMCGIDVPHFPIWDCYHSNIESEALQLIGKKKDEISDTDIRRACRRLIAKYIPLQKKQLQELGIFAYWDKAIMTSSFKSKVNAIEAFGELYDTSYLQKDTKTTLWCVNCQKDLDKKETEYKECEFLSLLVKFPVIYGLEEMGENVYLLVMTCTPWTLSANIAIVVHPNCDYVAVEADNNDIFIIAENALKYVKTANKRVIKRMKGLELDKITYAHPFLDRNSDVILSKGISSVKGTGCIQHSAKSMRNHTVIRQRNNQEIISIVDSNGKLNGEAGQFCGIGVFESSELISLELQKRGCLLSSEIVKKPYPHCQYCKEPAITRITDKWVPNLNANDFQQRIFEIMGEINWKPHWRKKNISNIIINKTDWNLSKRRIWGIPVPSFYCSKCDTQFSIAESVIAFKDIIGKKGFSRLLSSEPDEILSDGILCSRCGGREFKWEPGILDAEFVSAMSYRLIPSSHRDSTSVVDICLQNGNSDGDWLLFSLLSSIATADDPPFKSVVFHRSIDNSKEISLQDIIKEFSVDIFRLFAISMNPEKDSSISLVKLKSAYELYRRIRNISGFMLGNLHDYLHPGDKVEYKHLQEIDRWILHRLAKTIDQVTEAYDNCQYHRFYHLIRNFCFQDMSNLYISIVKRRLYTSPQWSSSRRAVQTVIYEVLVNFVKLIAPVLSFTAEDIWQHIPGLTEQYPSVYMSNWSNTHKNFISHEIESRWKIILKIRGQVYKSLNKAGAEEGIKEPSQAYLMLYTSDTNIYKLLEDYIDDLEMIFKVSKVRLMPPDATIPDGIWESDEIKGLFIEARRATGEKCERCWIYSDTVGANDQYPTLCYKCIAALEGGTNYI